MKEFTITSTMNMEAESRESLIEQIETAKREIRDDSGIGWDLLDCAEVDEVIN